MPMEDKHNIPDSQKNTLAELLPADPTPPEMPIIASHPFDDKPPSAGPPSSVPTSSPMGLRPGMGQNTMAGKVYPPNQPMVFNPSNPNAPPIYPCGICHKEVHENDHAILCESGCNFWFHRACTGLTEPAFTMLTQEIYAEWVCDKCLNTKSIPLVKLKP
ncbi:hypothetical protein SNE40_004849 [Patella caerulea]|uniref:PHD-type domain-containing protein n=1 Tax=Patella caerulea TaxID=87958 RepID=A0AAN8KCV4_PATCE